MSDKNLDIGRRIALALEHNNRFQAIQAEKLEIIANAINEIKEMIKNDQTNRTVR